MKIQDSMERILREDAVVTDLFYEIFLDRYPDVRRYFQKVDLHYQAVVLKNALLMIQLKFTHQYPATTQYLRVLGHRHSERGIHHDLYLDWRDCLLDTLERFHADDWNDVLESEWRAAIEEAIDCMIEGYHVKAAY